MRMRLPLAAALLLLCACRTSRPLPAAEAWPEADRLFRSEPRWLGGDAAYSVELGDRRTLWLFGDSFVDPQARGKRALAAMPRNTIAVQTGEDPATAKLAFHWKERDGKPSEFFAGEQGEWLWPAHGVRLGGKLLLFFMKVKPEKGGLGFALTGSAARLVTNPDSPADEWRVGAIALPDAPAGVLFGSALLAHEGFLYAYCPREPSHEVLLARWTLERAKAGDLSGPEWWTGRGWDAAGSPAAVMSAGTEFSVHRDGESFLQVQTTGFGAADLTARRADRPEGPWSPPVTLFRPEESGRVGVMVYAGKAHPHLKGGALAATYATNSFDFGGLISDLSLYYPRFVKLRPPQ